MSIQGLHAVILQCIASYIPDGVTLCHFEATCRDARAAVKSTTGLWDTLYCQRWSFLNGEPPFDKQMYGERHRKDQRATKMYQSICRRSENAAVGDERANALMDEDAADEELCQLFHMWKEVLDVGWVFYDQATSDKERERATTLI